MLCTKISNSGPITLIAGVGERVKHAQAMPSEPSVTSPRLAERLKIGCINSIEQAIRKLNTAASSIPLRFDLIGSGM